MTTTTAAATFALRYRTGTPLAARYPETARGSYTADAARAIAARSVNEFELVALLPLLTASTTGASA